jgi:hypothetical protein
LPCTIQFCTVQFSFALLHSLQVEISLGGVGIDAVDSDVGDDNDDENGERVRISVGLKGKTSLVSIFIKSSLSPRLHISTSCVKCMWEIYLYHTPRTPNKIQIKSYKYNAIG